MSELKQIKRHHERQLKNMDKKLTMYQIHPDDVSWLIQQAERAQEYDRELISLEDNKHYVSEMLAKNKRYREVIDQIKNNIPLEFNHSSEYEAKKNVIRLINIDNLVNEYLEESK